MTYYCIYLDSRSGNKLCVSQADLETIYYLYTNDCFHNIRTYRVVNCKDGYNTIDVSVDIWYDYMTIINSFGTIIDHYKHEEE